MQVRNGNKATGKPWTDQQIVGQVSSLPWWPVQRLLCSPCWQMGQAASSVAAAVGVAELFCITFRLICGVILAFMAELCSGQPLPGCSWAGYKEEHTASSDLTSSYSWLCVQCVAMILAGARLSAAALPSRARSRLAADAVGALACICAADVTSSTMLRDGASLSVAGALAQQSMGAAKLTLQPVRRI